MLRYNNLSIYSHKKLNTQIVKPAISCTTDHFLAPGQVRNLLSLNIIVVGCFFKLCKFCDNVICCNLTFVVRVLRQHVSSFSSVSSVNSQYCIPCCFMTIRSAMTVERHCTVIHMQHNTSTTINNKNITKT